MADLDRVEKHADADMAALYWWRRDAAVRGETEEPAPLNERRLVSVAARAASSTPHIVDLPGNRLRTKAEARHAREAQAPKDETALDADLLAAIHDERRNALVALVIGLIATAVPAAAAIYAATMREPVALGFAIAGGCAASVTLYHATRWFLLTRADALPNILA